MILTLMNSGLPLECKTGFNPSSMSEPLPWAASDTAHTPIQRRAHPGAHGRTPALSTLLNQTRVALMMGYSKSWRRTKVFVQRRTLGTRSSRFEIQPRFLTHQVETRSPKFVSGKVEERKPGRIRAL